MNRTEPAQFVRWVDPDEALDDLVEEAKGLTWEAEAEHALLESASGSLLLVRGGRDGISFIWNEPAATLEMDGPGGSLPIVKIYWHTHPRVTGPSDGDLTALLLLHQPESIIFELGGDRNGTRIRPKF